MASEEGIDAIVATPHFRCDMGEARTQEIKELYTVVRNWWKRQEPDKEMYLGNELFYSEGLVEALEQGRALTMNETAYVLVEFPVYEEFSRICKAVQQLRYAGYIPIIAHVERYEHLRERAKLQELIDMGAYIQVNASAVSGKHGWVAKHRITKYIKWGLVHFIATDAHNSRERRPAMKSCVAYLEKKLGRAKVRQLLVENPEKMLRGEEING